jgi:uncharacterized protein YhhL (DUF1145 family)
MTSAAILGQRAASVAARSLMLVAIVITALAALPVDAVGAHTKTPTLTLSKDRTGTVESSTLSMSESTSESGESTVTTSDTLPTEPMTLTTTVSDQSGSKSSTVSDEGTLSESRSPYVTASADTYSVSVSVSEGTMSQTMTDEGTLTGSDSRSKPTALVTVSDTLSVSQRVSETPSWVTLSNSEGSSTQTLSGEATASVETGTPSRSGSGPSQTETPSDEGTVSRTRSKALPITESSSVSVTDPSASPTESLTDEGTVSESRTPPVTASDTESQPSRTPGTPSESPTVDNTKTLFTDSISTSDTGSSIVTLSPTQSRGSPSVSETPTDEDTVSESPSRDATSSESVPTPSTSETPSQVLSESPTFSRSPSGPSFSETQSDDGTATLDTMSQSQTVSQVQTLSPSLTYTDTLSDEGTLTASRETPTFPSPSLTWTATESQSGTDSFTPDGSLSETRSDVFVSKSPSETPSDEKTRSESRSFPVTETESRSRYRNSRTRTLRVTESDTYSESQSQGSPSLSESPSDEDTRSESLSAPQSSTDSRFTPSESATPDNTHSVESQSVSASISEPLTVTEVPTETVTDTLTDEGTLSRSGPTPSQSVSDSSLQTRTISPPVTKTKTGPRTATDSSTVSIAITDSTSKEKTRATMTLSDDPTASFESQSLSDSRSQIVSLSPSISVTVSSSNVESVSDTYGTPSQSETDERTLSRTQSITDDETLSESDSGFTQTPSTSYTVSMRETLTGENEGGNQSHTLSDDGTATFSGLTPSPSMSESDEGTVSRSRTPFAKTASPSPTDEETASGTDSATEHTFTETRSRPRTRTALVTGSPSLTETPSDERTSSKSQSPTDEETRSESHTETITDTITVTISRPRTKTAAETPSRGSLTLTDSDEGTLSRSTSPSRSPTYVETKSPTQSGEPTSSESPSLTSSEPSGTGTVTEPVSGTVTDEGTLSRSPSRATMSESEEDTLTRTTTQPESATPLVTVSPSGASESLSRDQTSTESRSRGSLSDTEDLTGSWSSTRSQAITDSYSLAETITDSSSITGSFSDTLTDEGTISKSGGSRTRLPTRSPSLSGSETDEPTDTGSDSGTVQASDSFSRSGSPSVSLSASESLSKGNKGTETPSAPVTISESKSERITATRSMPFTDSESKSVIDTKSPTPDDTVSRSTSRSLSGEPTLTDSAATETRSKQGATESPSMSIIPTDSPSLTPSPPVSLSDSLSDEKTVSEPTFSPSFSGDTLSVSDSQGTQTISGEVSGTFSNTHPTEPVTESAGTSSPSPSSSSTLTQSNTETDEGTLTRSGSQSVVYTDSVSVSDTKSLDRSRTKRATDTETAGATPTETMSVVETPSPTPDETVTLSVAETPTRGTLSDSPTNEFTGSLSRSDTLSRPTPSLSAESTGTASGGTLSISPTWSQTVTTTESYSGEAPTSTDSLSDDESQSFSRSHSLTDDLTLSESMSESGSLETHTLAITPSDTASLSETSDPTASRSTSASVSMTITETDSLRSPGPNSFYEVFPHANNNLWEVGRSLVVMLRAVPYVSNDAAALLDVSKACVHPITKVPSPEMIQLRYAGRDLVQNWTVTPRKTGTYRVCYFSNIKEQWYSVDKPYNITVVPWVHPETTTIISNKHNAADGFSVSVQIGGGNATTDKIVLLQYPKQCNDPLAGVEAQVPVWLVSGNLMVFRSGLSMNSASLFTLCYLGYPFTWYTQLTSKAIATEPSITFAAPTAAGLRAGGSGAIKLNGFGFAVRDLMYITNDTVNRCNAHRAAGPQKLNWGIPDSLLRFYTTRTFTFPRITFSGTAIACFRGNTSKSYTNVGQFAIEPVAVGYFTPNGTQALWSTGSMLELAFRGSGLDSRFDIVGLAPNRSLCGAEFDNVTVLLDPSFAEDGSNRNMFRVIAPQPSNWTVCYGSNSSAAVAVGTIQVVRNFYRFNRAFRDGVPLGVSLDVELRGYSLNVSTDSLLLVRRNATNPEQSCEDADGAHQPSYVNAYNKTVGFIMESSGYHVICAYTAPGPVLMSQVLPIYPDAPSNFTPATVAYGEPFELTFSGGLGLDLTFGDSVTPCFINGAASLVATGARKARGSLTTFGDVPLCFKTAVVAGNGDPVVTRVLQPLQVSPIATSATVYPGNAVVGSKFNVSVSGMGLSADDRLYACNASNPLAHETPNTTAFTFTPAGQDNTWLVEARLAGVFSLCYSYGRAPSFPPGPLRGSPTIRVDPGILSITPRSMQASVPTAITISGDQIHRLRRVFVNVNDSDCSPSNPFAIDFVPGNITESAGTYTGTIPRRGVFVVCYTGESGASYAAPVSLTVLPHLDAISISQTAVEDVGVNTEYYSNYPATVTLQGGALDYARDTYFAVRGSICEVTEQTALTSVAPPQGARSSMALTLTAPQEGKYSICYRFDGSAATLFPDRVISIVNGLSYDNKTLSLRGPYTLTPVVVEFAFAVGPRTSAAWTVFESPSVTSAIAIPLIPYGQIAFRARVLDRNGLQLYVLTAPHFSELSTIECGAVPTAIDDLDATRKFSRIVIILYNYKAAGCNKVTGTGNAATLARNLLNEIDREQSLVTDPVLVMTTLADVVTTQQDVVQRYDDAELLLSQTESMLQRPTSEIDDTLLRAHTGILNTVATSISAINNDPTNSNPAKGQEVALGVIDRMKLIASRHCDRGLRSEFNSTLSVVSMAAQDYVPSSSRSGAAFTTGYGVTTMPEFAATTSAAYCVLASLFTQNILPQRSKSATSRRMLLQSASTPNAVAAPVLESDLPVFNIPLLTFSLPKSSGVSPFAATPTIRFEVSQTPPTRMPGETGEGYTVEAVFYKFVPDGPTASSGEWVRDDSTQATVNSDASVLTVTHNTTKATDSVNSQNEPVTSGNFFVISGRVLVRPVVFLPSDTDTDVPLAVLICGLVLLHIVLCVAGHFVDRYRDARHEPDIERMLQPENNITLHRFLYVGVRKPHEQISTYLRVTVLFTFLFALAFVSMLVLLASPFEPEPWYSIPLGLVAALAASPFGAVTRIVLRTQLWDYASGIAAALGVASILIATPLIGIYFGTLTAFLVGIAAFFVAVAYFRASWGFEVQPNPGPFPKVFGIGVHVVIEIAAFVYLLYLAVVNGTPRKFHAQWVYWQVFFWGVAFDFLVLEPAKNRLFLWLRAVVVSLQDKKDARDPTNTRSLGPAFTYTAGKALPPPTPSSDASFEEYDLDDTTGDMSFAEVDETTADRSSRRGGPRAAFGNSVLTASELEDVGSDFAEDDAQSIDVDIASTVNSTDRDDLSEIGDVDAYGDEPSERVDPPYGASVSGSFQPPYGTHLSSPHRSGPTAAAFRNQPLRARSSRGGGSRSSVSSLAVNPVDFAEVTTDDDD